MISLYVPLSLIAGALLAVQAGANAQLSKATGSPFVATTLQLVVGALVLALFAGASGGLSALSLLASATWWHVLGGTASAFYVVSTILLFPRIGAVVSVSLLIAGQIVVSTILDGFGLLGLSAAVLSASVALGTALILVGAALIAADQKAGHAKFDFGQIAWFALALLAGAVLPVQGAVNALLRQDLGGAAFAVGAVSFVVATLAMAAVTVIIQVQSDAKPLNLRGLSQLPWWGWLGGFAGATYVTTVFTAIPAIGVAATVGLTIAGQQIASVFVDTYGWFRLPQRTVSRLRLTGVIASLAGIVVIKAL